MQRPDPSNQYFDMAVQFVNHTAQHLFLTGKAGTGKTTFLKYIKNTSPKKLAVVAPTGVAAINAGGVTIHSFFQLPLGTFLPGGQNLETASSGNFYNRTNLLKHLRLSGPKRVLIQELDLLIIDEVSMVRADILDAIDTVLRHVRRQPDVAFGGIQMLFIGDLFQLPPVVREAEWEVLSTIYQGPLFFHALALQQTPPLYLELKKIYRQSDTGFIGLLNNIRNNQVLPENMRLLREYYRPGFKPDEKEKYIILTSHNYKAEAINKKELEALKTKVHTFEAGITGEFNENSLPAEKKLRLKEGAQVMFIRNDKGESRRYYNGKIGTVSRILSGDIYVTFPDEDGKLLVTKETWKNLQYQYNREEDRIEEVEKGTFSQYPLRLAWAITIHKSQGLTFSKAIIDAGSSFAPGQVYVALSRLTSLEGLILRSPIEHDCISSDGQAVAFARSEREVADLLRHLQSAKKQYLLDLLIKAFSWNSLEDTVKAFETSLHLRKITFIEKARRLAKELLVKIQEQQAVARKFTRQLQEMTPRAGQDRYRKVHQRVQAATGYFQDSLQKELSDPLSKHYEAVKKKAKAKTYLKEVSGMIAVVSTKKEQLKQVLRITEGLSQGTDSGELLRILAPSGRKDLVVQDKQKKKAAKGETQRISLAMFKEGKDIATIARERGLVTGTIASHLTSFIPTGEININDLVEEHKVKELAGVIRNAEKELSASEIRELSGGAFSYDEIRAVMRHCKMIAEQLDQERH